MRKVILENLIRQGVNQCLNNHFLKEGGIFSDLFGLNNDDVAPDDDNGQRSLDSYPMKMMRGWLTGKKIQKTDNPVNEFFDASGYKLCFGNDSFEPDERVSLNLIGKLLNNLADILDDCDLPVMTITPYSEAQARKLFPRNPKNGLGLFVICLGVAESQYDLWENISLNEDSNEMSLIYQKYGKPDRIDGWSGFWDWLLKDVMKIRHLPDKRLFTALNKNSNSNQGIDVEGVNCYFTIGVQDQIENIVEKLTKMKNRGIPKDKSGKFQFLLKMLKNNKWIDGNELTPEQKTNIKAEIKKMRQSGESWKNWGKRNLGLDDEQEDEDI